MVFLRHSLGRALIDFDSLWFCLKLPKNLWLLLFGVGQKWFANLLLLVSTGISDNFKFYFLRQLLIIFNVEKQSLLNLYIRYLITTIIIAITASSVNAQRLSGVWGGKISRMVPGGKASVESLEMQISQFGNSLTGNTFAFRDTSRFVLYRMDGRLNRKKKEIFISENGWPTYLLPLEFYPCEKKYLLNYFKIGKTQYLVGTWGGKGAFTDTTCFPNEELLVVLQKLPKPDYPIEYFVTQKLVNYYSRRKNADHIITATADSLQFALFNTNVELPQPEDSSLADRKIDIQMIAKLPDSLIKITFYDNAIIDDDTISVFINKKAVLVKERISAAPLTYSFSISKPNTQAEILMQAENLGSIPPNTALMIVESGSKRYEVRLSAGFTTHAAIIITYAPD